MPYVKSEQGGDGGGPPFHWDIAIDIGDMSGGQDVPDDEEGAKSCGNFPLWKDIGAKMFTVSAAITIAAVCLSRRPGGGRNGLIRWGPTVHSGVDASRRPYPTTGTWERYSFTVGNVLFLLMSDINEPSQTVGRGTLGGNPAGVVTGETFAWWRRSRLRLTLITSSFQHITTCLRIRPWLLEIGRGKARCRRSLAESLPRL